MNEMELKISSAAKAALNKLMLKHSLNNVVKLSAIGGGPIGLNFSLSLVQAAELEDTKFNIDGIDFCVKPYFVDVLSGMFIDVETINEEPVFVFKEILG